MCGFAGYFSKTTEVSESVCHKMIDSLRHRGPDDSGVWVDSTSGIALGHRRLSIQDLSPLGYQPMHSASGRYVVAFNGEIYNFKTLKQQLERLDYYFTGHSDTEVLLAAVDVWGLEKALSSFVGMFAFSLWDRRERVLTLARDRMGEKPLYYGWQGKAFLFGSELKALRMHQDWIGSINRAALALQMRHSYIPAPHSIYQGIQKLPPGTFIQISHDISQGVTPEPYSYWSMREVAGSGKQHDFDYNDQQAIFALNSLLGETIQEKMVADVPLGAFLSGGVDSSTVVAIMQAHSSRPVKTFSIGFHEKEYSEAKHAKEVAKYLKTDHTELYVTPEQAMAVIPKLPSLYDEPFSDSSQIPTFLVSEMTQKQVTVALSGDGGDELFGGYNRHLKGEGLWNKLKFMPLWMRTMIANVIAAVPPQDLDRLGSMIGGVVPQLKVRTGDRLHKLAGVLASSSPEQMYRNFVSHWRDPEGFVLDAIEPATVLTDPLQWPDLDNFTECMMFLDTLSYLPDDILVKVDRAAMGISLETRVPLLDHRIVEFAWRLPMHQKIRNGKGKWILRQVLYKYVPKELIERPKMGFGVPIGDWLRGPLRDWAEDLLSESRLRQEGYFRPEPIRLKWKEHLSGQRNWQYDLWDVLMFQAWHEQWER